MKVLFSPNVRTYFQDLEDVLFEENYFSFEDSAVQYVQELIFEIRDTLPNCLKKDASPYFDKYGKNMKYSFFRRNRNTMWYVFFNEYVQNEETVYLVRFISNNHVISQFM